MKHLATIAALTAAVILAGCDQPHRFGEPLEAKHLREMQEERGSRWITFQEVECKFPYESRVRITDGFYRGQVGNVKEFDLKHGYVVELNGLYGPTVKNIPGSAMEDADRVSE